MSELKIMTLIDQYRNGERHDINDLLQQIYETCEQTLDRTASAYAQFVCSSSEEEDECWDEQAEDNFDDEVPEEPEDFDLEIGFNPYDGCYDFDC